MNIEIDRIADMVSLRMGEYPDWRNNDGNISVGENVSVREMIEIILLPMALTLTRSSPLEKFTSPVDIRSLLYSGIEWEDGMDIPFFELPADYCRLYGVKFPGWPRILSDENCGDPQMCAFGSAAPSWLAGRSRRPRIVIENRGEQGYRLHAPLPGKTWPEVASYIPKPEYEPSAGVLRKFDPGLLLDLIDKIADAIRVN